MAITTDHVLLTRRLVQAVRVAKSATDELNKSVKIEKSTFFNKWTTWGVRPVIDYVLDATKAHEDSVALLLAYNAETALVDTFVKEYAIAAINLNERVLDELIKGYHYRREAEAITDVLPLRNTTL